MRAVIGYWAGRRGVGALDESEEKSWYGRVGVRVALQQLVLIVGLRDK